MELPVTSGCYRPPDVVAGEVWPTSDVENGLGHDEPYRVVNAQEPKEQNVAVSPHLTTHLVAACRSATWRGCFRARCGFHGTHEGAHELLVSGAGHRFDIDVVSA